MDSNNEKLYNNTKIICTKLLQDHETITMQELFIDYTSHR